MRRVACVRFEPGEVAADFEVAAWRALEAHALCDTVTGAPPEQEASFKLGWTADALRVLFSCEDREPWATLTERDAPLYQEEVVEVFLNPFADGICYFEVEVNPLNTVLDLLVRNGRSGLVKNFRWSCDGLETAVRKIENGWCAELVIPFLSITPEPPQTGAVWRGNFLRIDRPRDAPRELSAWSPTGRPLFHVPERFGEIVFAER